MKFLVTLAAVATVAVGAATTIAPAAASPMDRMTEMMTRLQGPQSLAAPHSAEAKHWAIFNWLFRDLGADAADDEVITTLADPVDPPLALTPVAPTVLAPNRITKRQIGPGQKMTVHQYGAGNTASVFQSN